MEQTFRVFVYGSLRQGEGNHRRLAGDKFVGHAHVPGQLYSLRAYPGAVFGGQGTIYGEVYEVSAQSLQGLDHLEGYNEAHPEDSHYRRVVVTLNDNTEAFAYEYNRKFDHLPLVEGGDWTKAPASIKRW